MAGLVMLYSSVLSFSSWLIHH